MAASKLTASVTTVVSTKGQVILPKAVRDLRKWGVGTRLIVEETEDGVLLRQAPLFSETNPSEVFASLRGNGPAKTIDEMKAGILAEAKRRHARD
ncbi:AbrB/MazE/SpoVT family DNA-binding domain-containing protein [Variibacter gotjawalensis]|nr:AbrB/MazE/SpoVT family DNA-binding domain-containing protein [Variibacter gotjawalensis]NIK50159.1 AbrB family looped-hinge helix DNA binding protein [Variibacter gotjawalensis]